MSSGSESDDDYIPGEPEQVSEEESADEETNLQYENELEHKSKKRKSKQLANGKKKIKTNKNVTALSKEQQKGDIDTQVLEVDKKREDDLWAKFLEGTETKPRSSNNQSNEKQTSNPIFESLEKKEPASVKEVDKEREKRIFEFAGETIVVENNVISEKIKTPDTPTVSKQQGTSRSKGGLSSVLGQLNKKNRLSTLEKSKLDWNTYKKEEGVEEEITNHNKGKAGFLDRRDFLERTDVRQYEIERDLRMNRRSNR